MASKEDIIETWEIIISIAAGLITIITLIDKFGILGQKVKKLDNYLETIEGLPKKMDDLKEQVGGVGEANIVITRALRGIIKNELYRSFKEHREIGAWTDDECRVQTSLHDIYQALGGNGEETIWWQKKSNWKIVSEDEYDRLYAKMIEGC